MKPTTTLLYLCFGVSLAVGQHFDLHPKTVRVAKLDGKCAEYKHLPIYFKDVHLTLKNRVNIINLKVVIEKDMPNPLKLTIILKRCPSKEALDSCEIYQTININRLCDLIKPNDKKPWSPLVQVAKPPFSCPLKKGVSRCENGTFDGTGFSAFPVYGWYWIAKAKVLDAITNEVVMCVNFEGQIIPV